MNEHNRSILSLHVNSYQYVYINITFMVSILIIIPIDNIN